MKEKRENKERDAKSVKKLSVLLLERVTQTGGQIYLKKRVALQTNTAIGS